MACIASVVSYRLSVGPGKRKSSARMAKDWGREAHSLSPPFILLQFLSRAIVSVLSFARRDQLQANRLKKAFLW